MSTVAQKPTRQTVRALRGGEPPEGWVSVLLPEACEINPPKPPTHALPPNDRVTFVPMPAVDAEAGAITKPEARPFSEVRNGFTAFQEADVIFAKITPCMENGKAAIARNLLGGLGFGSTEFHVLRPRGAVLPEFIYHFIRRESFRKAAEAEMTGSVGQKRVSLDFMKQVEFPLAPLAEQKRIVEKIESLLAGVNAARARLAKVPRMLSRFRQAVLAAGCSGHLTEEWRARQNLEGAAGRLLAEIISKRKARIEETGLGARERPLEPGSSEISDVPEEWVFATVDQLTCLVTSGSRGWARYYSDSGPHFIRAQDLNTDSLVLNGTAHVTPPANAEGRRTRIQSGDLLVTITGANVTKSAVVGVDPGEAYVSQHVALVRPVEPDTGRFLYLWTVSPRHGREKLLEDAYGAGKPGLKLDNIREMVVAVPPLEEQSEIVRRVQALFKLADAIEERVEAATKRAEKLTQAILAKAFRGELVPTEAGLARREGRAYEPATALLEHIRSQRGQNPLPKRGAPLKLRKLH